MKTRIVHPGNFTCFAETYQNKLIERMKENPKLYNKDPKHTWECHGALVAEKILSSIQDKGIFSVDYKLETFRLTCKSLGIKHTGKAIEEFICL